MKSPFVGTGAGMVVLFCLAQLAPAGDWVVENASGLMWFEDMKPRHLAVNSAGRPCAAFGGDQLYYAEQEAGGTWKVGTVASSVGVGSYASLVLHNGVSPRIAFAGNGDGFGYAEGTLVGDEWQWSIEEIAGQGDHCSLALDSSGQPHIAYYEDLLRGLRHIRREAGAWTAPTTLDTPGDPSRGYSIVVDDDDYPHIVSVTSSGSLNYHYEDVAGWHKSVITTAAHAGVPPCLRITTDFLHLVFWEEDGNGEYNLQYRAFATGTPVPAVIDEIVAGPLGVPAGSSLSMDILPTSQPNIAYTFSDRDFLYRAERSGASAWLSWATAATRPSSVSVALSAGGKPFFSCRIQDQGIAMASTTTGGGSSLLAITEYAAGGDAGEHADLALLGDGSPVLAYQDSTGKGLVVLKRAGESDWGAHGGDPDPDAGSWVSLAAAMGDPLQYHAACYVSDDGDLRYQRSDGAPVEGPADVDFAVDVGTHASLAVHPVSGNPAIAYRDETNQQLKFVRRGILPGGTPIWLPEVIDSTAGTGAYASLAYSPDGHPHVVYRADSTSELRVISNTGSGWNPPVTVLVGIDPIDIAAAFDTAGELHLSFISAIDDSLWRAWTSITGWSWEPVAGLTGVSGDTGIVVDSAGRPNILYREDEFIRVARKRSDGTWNLDRVATLVRGTISGKLTASMIAGPGDRPMVCYYDPGEHDMMVAWLPSPQITGITETSPDHYRLNWWGDDHDIWIDRSPDLSPGSWTPAAGPIQGSFHTINETAGRMFYRLRTE